MLYLMNQVNEKTKKTTDFYHSDPLPKEFERENDEESSQLVQSLQYVNKDS